MIDTLNNKDKKEWPEWVSALTYAYNCTVSAAMGLTPYYIMYGCRPILSIDVEYRVTLPEVSDKSRINYVQKLKSRLK